MAYPRWHMTKNELSSLYAKKSITQIAKDRSVSTATVFRAMQRFDINPRTKAEGLKKNWLVRSHAPEKQPRWKGGKFYDGKGYVRIFNPSHPRAIITNGKPAYVYEHVLNWEKAYGKLVPKGYLIHHLNGIRDDNRPENLAVLPNKQAHSTWTITQLLQKRIREIDPYSKDETFLPERGKVMQDGYVMIFNPHHPRAHLGNAGKRSYVYEHIVNWEKANKQSVPKDAIIHHLNGIKTDNRPENLRLIASRRGHSTWTLVTLLRNRLQELEKQRRVG